MCIACSFPRTESQQASHERNAASTFMLTVLAGHVTDSVHGLDLTVA